jgi:hypothetical protein
MPTQKRYFTLVDFVIPIAATAGGLALLRPAFGLARVVYGIALHERSGTWPTADSGAITKAPGETWSAADSALRAGGRGLPGGSSLFRLLARARGAPNPGHLHRRNLARNAK